MLSGTKLMLVWEQRALFYHTWGTHGRIFTLVMLGNRTRLSFIRSVSASQLSSPVQEETLQPPVPNCDVGIFLFLKASPGFFF